MAQELSSVAYGWNGDVQSFREIADYNNIDIFDILPDNIQLPPDSQVDIADSTTAINWFV